MKRLTILLCFVVLLLSGCATRSLQSSRPSWAKSTHLKPAGHVHPVHNFKRINK